MSTANEQSIASIAATVSNVDEFLIKALPVISFGIGLIPGAGVAAPFIGLLPELLTALDNAAKAVAAGNPSLAFDDVLSEIKAHLTPGQANASALGPSA